MKNVDYLITHSGVFHADDVCAGVVLQSLFQDAELIRTRDADCIDKLRSRACIFDVGREYDASELCFDHHQPDAPTRDDGTPYSAFGLIWRDLGREFLALRGYPPHALDALHKGLDRSLVQLVDKVDTGRIFAGDAPDFWSASLPALIYNMNPTQLQVARRMEIGRRAELESDRRLLLIGLQDEAFTNAMNVADMMIRSTLEDLHNSYEADRIVEKAILKTWGSPVLELDEAYPFQSTVARLGADHLLYVLTPEDDGQYRIDAVRKSVDTLENRKPFPEAWGGLSGRDLQTATGVEGAVFCHAGRFITIAADRAAAIELLKAALQTPEPEIAGETDVSP